MAIFICLYVYMLALYMFTLVLWKVLSICCACALYVHRGRVGNVLSIPCMCDMWRIGIKATLNFEQNPVYLY